MVKQDWDASRLASLCVWVRMLVGMKELEAAVKDKAKEGAKGAMLETSCASPKPSMI